MEKSLPKDFPSIAPAGHDRFESLEYLFFVTYRLAAGSGVLFAFGSVLSLALAALAAAGFARVFLIGTSSDHQARRILQRIEQVGSVVVRVFVYAGMAVYANAALDRSRPVERAAEIRAISAFELNIGSLINLSHANLQWSDQAGQTDSIIIYGSEKRWLWVGEPVLVHTKRGWLRVPWIAKLERDEKRYADQVLAILPTASQAWKRRVTFELDHRRWGDAYESARQYLSLYPADYEFALSTSAALGVASQHREAVALLEPFLEHRADYTLYNVVGWGLAKLGETDRAIALLQASIPMDPKSFWAYYHLGYVFRNTGRTQEAITMFERVLELRPNIPEVNEQLRSLRNRLEVDKKNLGARLSAPRFSG